VTKLRVHRGRQRTKISRPGQCTEARIEELIIFWKALRINSNRKNGPSPLEEQNSYCKMKMEAAGSCDKSVAINGRILPHIRDNVHLCQRAYDHKIWMQTVIMTEQVDMTYIGKEYNISARKSELGRPKRRREYNYRWKTVMGSRWIRMLPVRGSASPHVKLHINQPLVIWAVLGFDAAYSDKSVSTFRYNLSVPFSMVKQSKKKAILLFQQLSTV
jgi:hypothetical protein